MDKSPLSRLPPELRLCIYEFALTHSEPVIRIVPWNEHGHGLSGIPTARYWMINQDNDVNPLNLTGTCRQIHAECSKLFFKVNTNIYLHNNGSLGPAESLHDFLDFIGPDASSRIRSVKIEIESPKHICLQQKCDCPSFRELVDLRKWALRHPQVTLSAEFYFPRTLSYAIVDITDLGPMAVLDVDAKARNFVTAFEQQTRRWIERLRTVTVEEEA